MTKEYKHYSITIQSAGEDGLRENFYLSYCHDESEPLIINGIKVIVENSVNWIINHHKGFKWNSHTFHVQFITDTKQYNFRSIHWQEGLFLTKEKHGMKLLEVITNPVTTISKKKGKKS